VVNNLQELPVGVSGDGRVGVGGRYEVDFDAFGNVTGQSAFRLESDELTLLEAPSSFPPRQFVVSPFSPGDSSAAFAASHDGRVIVGSYDVNAGIIGEPPIQFHDKVPRAARWTDGVFEALAPPPPGDCPLPPVQGSATRSRWRCSPCSSRRPGAGAPSRVLKNPGPSPLRECGPRSRRESAAIAGYGEPSQRRARVAGAWRATGGVLQHPASPSLAPTPAVVA